MTLKGHWRRSRASVAMAFALLGCSNAPADDPHMVIATEQPLPLQGRTHQCRQRWLTLTGTVVDEAQIIDNTLEDKIVRQIGMIRSKTGHQIVVATSPSLEGQKIAQIALCQARRWGLGNERRDDGLLILVAPKEQDVRIEIGTGLNKKLTNEEAYAIIQANFVPTFRNGDFSGGLSAGLSAIAEEIQ